MFTKYSSFSFFDYSCRMHLASSQEMKKTNIKGIFLIVRSVRWFDLFFMCRGTFGVW
jgi:hypothetical protein